METYVAEAVKAAAEKSYSRSVSDQNKINASFNKLLTESLASLVQQNNDRIKDINDNINRTRSTITKETDDKLADIRGLGGGIDAFGKTVDGLKS